MAVFIINMTFFNHLIIENYSLTKWGGRQMNLKHIINNREIFNFKNIFNY